MCHAGKIPNKINITGQVHIPSGDEHALRVAIADIGPIDVGMDASWMSFTFYSHGVYYEPKCGELLSLVTLRNILPGHTTKYSFLINSYIYGATIKDSYRFYFTAKETCNIIVAN